MGVPPVLGNAVAVSVAGLLVALAVAVGVELDVGVALAVDEALAVGVAVAVGLATMSSPVGLSSKPRTPSRSSLLRSPPLGLSSKPRSPPRSSPPRSSPVGLSSWANAAGAKTSAASIIAITSIKDLRIFFLFAPRLHSYSRLTSRQRAEVTEQTKLDYRRVTGQLLKCTASLLGDACSYARCMVWVLCYERVTRRDMAKMNSPEAWAAATMVAVSMFTSSGVALAASSHSVPNSGVSHNYVATTPGVLFSGFHNLALNLLKFGAAPLRK